MSGVDNVVNVYTINDTDADADADADANVENDPEIKKSSHPCSTFFLLLDSRKKRNVGVGFGVGVGIERKSNNLRPSASH